jgi:hypothetical protein
MCLACTLPTPSPFVPAAVGRCPGALADALLQLAEGVRGARLALLKDLRTRLLTLFAGERRRRRWHQTLGRPFLRCLHCWLPCLTWLP